MGVTSDIRAALEQRVLTVAGFPAAAQCHWENTKFKPTTGTPWAKLILVPDTRRPATLGPSPKYRHDGSFLVVLNLPEGTGSGAIDALADAVIDAFTVDDVATEGSTNVRFQWGERDDGVGDPPFFVVTVSIRWYVYADS